MTEHTPQFLLYDSELLDLESCFNVYHLDLRIDKNNTLSIFMFSGSIQFCIPFSFHINHAFIKIMSLYNICVM